MQRCKGTKGYTSVIDPLGHKNPLERIAYWWERQESNLQHLRPKVTDNRRPAAAGKESGIETLVALYR